MKNSFIKPKSILSLLLLLSFQTLSLLLISCREDITEKPFSDWKIEEIRLASLDEDLQPAEAELTDNTLSEGYLIMRLRLMAFSRTAEKQASNGLLYAEPAPQCNIEHKIADLRIINLTELNTQYPANSDLTEFFKGYVSWSMPPLTLQKLIENVNSSAYCGSQLAFFMQQVPVTGKTYQFEVQVEFKDGSVQKIVTEEVFLK